MFLKRFIFVKRYILVVMKELFFLVIKFWVFFKFWIKVWFNWIFCLLICEILVNLFSLFWMLSFKVLIFIGIFCKVWMRMFWELLSIVKSMCMGVILVFLWCKVKVSALFKALCNWLVIFLNKFIINFFWVLKFLLFYIILIIKGF